MPTADEMLEAADWLETVGDVPGEEESSAAAKRVARWLRDMARS